MKKKKFTITLPHCDHRNVQVKLEPADFTDTDDRLATIKFPSDSMDVKLYTMESDLRVLAKELLNNTNPNIIQPRHQQSIVDLSSEVHHFLSKKEMAQILQFREALAYLSVEESYRKLYSWVDCGEISREDFPLVCRYLNGQ